MAKEKKSRNQTSTLHFELFKSECEDWLERFGLHDWYREYVHKETIDAEAMVFSDPVTRNATITLSTNWVNREPTGALICENALHEALHILLRKFDDLANSRYASAMELDDSEEDAIRRIVTGFRRYLQEKK